MKKSDKHSSAHPYTRRRFLQAGSVGAATTALAACAASSKQPSQQSLQQSSRQPVQWHEEVDVAVCGSGAAGATAALFAVKAGADVMILEKSAAWGGTSAKSGFHVWIPNNAELRRQGIDDDRDSCLKYMTQYSYPHLFDPDSPTLGISTNNFELLEAYYDNASATIEQMIEWGACQFKQARLGKEQVLSPDYCEHSVYNKIPQGRALEPTGRDGSFAIGSHATEQLRETLLDAGVTFRMQYRAVKLHLNSKREVIGLECSDKDGQSKNIRTRRGVVFGTGCYTHNKDLLERYQALPIFGGCAVPTNEGDFVSIAGEIGAQLGNMSGAWRAQVVLEDVINYRAVLSSIFWPPGDSMFMVNKYGKRCVNEKRNYNDRAKELYYFDATRCEYPNLISFMVYDQRCADLRAGIYPIPPLNEGMDYVIKGDSIEELAEKIATNLEKHKSYTGGIRLHANFTESLNDTVNRFNMMAENGVDEDFERGGNIYDKAWYGLIPERKNPRWPAVKKKNPTMNPFQKEGPYYAIILCPGALGTSGGPLVDKHAQVLDYSNQPIKGLYAAGNCMAHPSANAYWAAGATIGTAMTYGKIAGEHVSKEPTKELV
jgi:3-oxosteroid 1-dehydrogenase